MMAEEAFVPDIRDKTINEAKLILREFGLDYRIEGDNNEIFVKSRHQNLEQLYQTINSYSLYLQT